MKLNMKFLAILSILMISVSCKKEGCTDMDATSYNEEAKTDDGTCDFSGSKVFWYKDSTSINLIDNDATTLTYYVDGEIVGTSPTYVSWEVAPNCEASVAVSVSKNLGSLKEQSFSYRVEDQTGAEYWSGTLTFNAATCEPVELSF